MLNLILIHELREKNNPDERHFVLMAFDAKMVMDKHVHDNVVKVMGYLFPNDEGLVRSQQVLAQEDNAPLREAIAD